VAAGHLVADRDAALGRDVDLDHLEHAGRQLVAAREPVDELVLLGLGLLDAVAVLLDEVEQLALLLLVVLASAARGRGP
jgi:hypothetical protein